MSIQDDYNLPDDIFQHLLAVCKSEEQIVKWLHAKRPFFQGLSAVELIKNEDGKDKIKELLNRLDTGDIS